MCVKELRVPGLRELHGVAGHTQQEHSGIEVGKAGWGEAGYFFGAMRSQPIQSGSDFRLSKMLIAVRRTKWREKRQREQLEWWQPWARGAGGLRKGNGHKTPGRAIGRNSSKGAKEK